MRGFRTTSTSTWSSAKRWRRKCQRSTRSPATNACLYREITAQFTSKALGRSLNKPLYVSRADFRMEQQNYGRCNVKPSVQFQDVFHVPPLRTFDLDVYLFDCWSLSWRCTVWNKLTKFELNLNFIRFFCCSEIMSLNVAKWRRKHRFDFSTMQVVRNWHLVGQYRISIAFEDRQSWLLSCELR